jgi:hypothetical protein
VPRYEFGKEKKSLLSGRENTHHSTFIGAITGREPDSEENASLGKFLSELLMNTWSFPCGIGMGKSCEIMDYRSRAFAS